MRLKADSFVSLGGFQTAVKFYQSQILAGFVTKHRWSWHFSDIEGNLFNAAFMVDVQLEGTNGLYGMTSICSNPVLCRA